MAERAAGPQIMLPFLSLFWPFWSLVTLVTLLLSGLAPVLFGRVVRLSNLLSSGPRPLGAASLSRVLSCHQLRRCYPLSGVFLILPFQPLLFLPSCCTLQYNTASFVQQDRKGGQDTQEKRKKQPGSQAKSSQAPLLHPSFLSQGPPNPSKWSVCQQRPGNRGRAAYHNENPLGEHRNKRRNELCAHWTGGAHDLPRARDRSPQKGRAVQTTGDRLGKAQHRAIVFDPFARASVGFYIQ